MGKFAKTWRWISNASTAAWLWSFVPPGLASGLLAWRAYLWHQPDWVILLAAAAMFTLVSWALAAWRWHRVTSVSQSSYNELRRRAYDTKLAELEGEAAAKTKYANARSNLLGSTSDAFSRMAEEDEARRQGRLERLRRGEDK